MHTASMHGDQGGNLAQKSILCMSAPAHETERVRDLANTFNVGITHSGLTEQLHKGRVLRLAPCLSQITI